MTTTVKCPTCQKFVSWTKESLFKPFCSERCKLIDLGEWADEKRAIPESTPSIKDWNTMPDNDEN